MMSLSLKFKTIYTSIIAALILFSALSVYAALDKIEGLEYVVRKVNDAPLEKGIAKKYDLYQLYFENRSDETFSIPGYSIDFDVDYLTLGDINSFSKDKSNKKLAIFSLATGAASLAFGGIAKTAANTAMRSFSFRNKSARLDEVNNYLLPSKTYILYPQDTLSIYFFVDKALQQFPQMFRFVCHDEINGLNNIVINNNLEVRDLDIKNVQGVIAEPSLEEYK